MDRLTSLTITGLTVDDIASLGALGRRESLNLAGAKAITSIDAIAGLRGLKTLNFADCQSIASIEPIAKLERLESLDLSGCDKLESLEPLKPIAGSLKSLKLTGVQIADIKPLAYLVKLKDLDLQKTKGLSADDRAWLKRQLPDVKIRF